jgi:hypothetical protein
VTNPAINFISINDVLEVIEIAAALVFVVAILNPPEITGNKKPAGIFMVPRVITLPVTGPTPPDLFRMACSLFYYLKTEF